HLRGRWAAFDTFETGTADAAFAVVIDFLIFDLRPRAFAGLAVGYQEPDDLGTKHAQRSRNRLRRSADRADQQDRPFRLLNYISRARRFDLFVHNHSITALQSPATVAMCAPRAAGEGHWPQARRLESGDSSRSRYFRANTSPCPSWFPSPHGATAPA